MLKPVRIVDPTDTPVSLEEARAHCQVDFTDEDDLIKAYIASATDYLDGYTGILGRALMPQTWRFSFECFESCLRLPLVPVGSVVVKYYDGSIADQELSASVYQLLEDALSPRVSLALNQSWPGTVAAREDAVRIEAVCGYEDASKVPAAIKQAILLLVGHWFKNREAVVIGQTPIELPLGAKALLSPWRHRAA
ncbi:MAG: head-tail connector protein [Parvibaculaceae bacterium]